MHERFALADLARRNSANAKQRASRVVEPHKRKSVAQSAAESSQNHECDDAAYWGVFRMEADYGEPVTSHGGHRECAGE